MVKINTLWNKARKSNDYYYSGDTNTPNLISNIFQKLATTKNNEERGIITLQYCGYTCELDIFWEDIFEENIIEKDIESKLVIELFVNFEGNTINNSEELLISDIYNPEYLERKMYEFILESIY